MAVCQALDFSGEGGFGGSLTRGRRVGMVRRGNEGVGMRGVSRSVWVGVGVMISAWGTAQAQPAMVAPFDVNDTVPLPSVWLTTAVKVTGRPYVDGLGEAAPSDVVVACGTPTTSPTPGKRAFVQSTLKPESTPVKHPLYGEYPPSGMGSAVPASVLPVALMEPNAVALAMWNATVPAIPATKDAPPSKV